MLTPASPLARLLMPRHGWHLAVLALGAACHAAPEEPPVPPETERAMVTSQEAGPPPSPELAGLAQAYWETYLELHPERATSIGDRRFDDRLTDLSSEGRAIRGNRFRQMKDRAGGIKPWELNRTDQVTLAMLHEALDQQILIASSNLEDWTVDPLRGPQVALPNLVLQQTWQDSREARRLIQRLRAIDEQMDQRIDGLLRSLEKGQVASRAAVEKALAQLDALMELPPEAWPLVTNAMEAGADAPEDIQPFAEDLILTAVREQAIPAFDRYRTVLREEILPAARSNDEPGLAWVPGGEALYRDLIRLQTSLQLTPDEIHAYGMQEVARIRNEIATLGRDVFDAPSFEATQAILMEDPAMFFSTPEGIEQTASAALSRANRSLDGWFGILPQTPCVVKPIPAYEEANTTMAYYRGPAEDGSRPGVYWVNTYAPGTRPRYNAEVLAFHEAIPGHHLQIAIAAELTGVPDFQRHEGCTAFVEGWALYTERLCDEMDLYTGDLDRFGMLGFDAWRAARLVVDTGLHSMGWTRQQAIDFMAENTLTSLPNIVNEVDRYIAWPGQALAYKIGQREIRDLRAMAEELLGPRFTITDFHDVVLRDGAVTLPVLRKNVEEWLATEAGILPVEMGAMQGTLTPEEQTPWSEPAATAPEAQTMERSEAAEASASTDG